MCVAGRGAYVRVLRFICIGYPPLYDMKNNVDLIKGRAFLKNGLKIQGEGISKIKNGLKN